jgi:Uma2 family endonuclease
MVAEPLVAEQEIHYPDSDGQPMADNTLQFEWIMTIKGSLEIFFQQREEVFVAGDLLWYPVEGSNTIRRAPDTMVIFGRPKGYRGSYRQWDEDNIAPQVVFEVLSPGNTNREMREKHQFYQRYGVEEYYIYDPLYGTLQGYQRKGLLLEEIARMHGWESPRMGIHFMLDNKKLLFFKPNGEQLLNHLEEHQERLKAEQRLSLAEQRLSLVEQEWLKAQQERNQFEEKYRKYQERLRELGLDPDTL